MVRPARMALDDKLYQRDLEVALALSVKELPTGTTDVEESRDKSTDRRGNDEAETVNKSPHLSNCSVASDYLDLDKITEEEDARGVRGRRRAASRAVVQQRSVLSEGSDGGGADDSEPDFATGEESEDDSDFSESGDDEAFTMRKSKGKRMKRKEAKVKSPVEKKEKKAKSACDATGDVFFPAVSGSSSGGRSPLTGVSVKSPNQSLRLGLSRLARVKPLHPTAASS
ncbi:RAD51-associated protein 1 [Camelus dromedarius]|uniref:RAD51-associated protein 1 n=1 Tax=Camelus dromedarius TaxID=9838 RepID=A0A5N4C6S0_CAMDR|nr:RAD51-associated protein 1 [Camelus dromedarius]